MTTSRAMAGVLHDFLGSYASRNSDYRGYWLFGQLPTAAEGWTWDLLTPAGVDDDAMHAGHLLANRRFAGQMAKARVRKETVREAQLSVSPTAGIAHGWQGEHWTHGRTLRLYLRVLMEDGTVHERECSIFVAPHDPARERRRRWQPDDGAQVVQRCNDAISAHAVRLRLEAEGIRACLADENLIGIHPLLAGALGGVKVVVAAPDVAAARAVLRRHREGARPTCPNCGSSRLRRRGLGRRAAFLTILLLGFPIGRSRAGLQCQACQHAWRE